MTVQLYQSAKSALFLNQQEHTTVGSVTGEFLSVLLSVYKYQVFECQS